MRSLDDWLAPIAPSAGHPAVDSLRLLSTAWPDLDNLPLPTVPNIPPWVTSKGILADRAAAQSEAMRFLSVFFEASRWSEIWDQLGDPVWLAHPGGRFGPLALEVLRTHDGPKATNDPSLRDPQTYDLAALRRLLPGGVADALHERMPLGDGYVVCVTAGSGRHSLLVKQHRSQWRVQSLPFVAVDLSWRDSVRVVADERDELRVALRVLTGLVLGQRGAVVALRNLMLDPLEGPHGPIDPMLVAQALRVGPRFDRIGWVIEPPKIETPPPLGVAMTKALKDRWRPSLGIFHPIWVRVSARSQWDDASRRGEAVEGTGDHATGPGPAGLEEAGLEEEVWWALLLQTVDRSHPRQTMRLAGLLAPEGHSIRQIR